MSAAHVTTHLARRDLVPNGPRHPAARAYAGRLLPDQTESIGDPYWAIFAYTCEHTNGENGTRFGMTPQGVAPIVKRVLSAIDEEQPA